GAIRTVSSGHMYLSQKVTGVVVDEYLRNPSGSNSTAYDLLTPREREVLQLLAEGNATKKIASILNISTKTAEAHRKQIMKKLGLSSIAELTKYAIKEGITSLDLEPRSFRNEE
ncbi:MAG TPA: DNA-binding response regulator, partial [Deltaproteobacteria bacterium]|nr:DNA-binding response regulator [Deltaproteobacteria bacterium]